MRDSKFVSSTRESSYLSWCIPSKFRKYHSWNCQISNEFVRFLSCFHNFLLLFLSAPVDDDFFMCKRSMRVNRSSTRPIPSVLVPLQNTLRIWDPHYTHARCLLPLATLPSDLRTMSVWSQLPQLLCGDGV